MMESANQLLLHFRITTKEHLIQFWLHIDFNQTGTWLNFIGNILNIPISEVPRMKKKGQELNL